MPSGVLDYTPERNLCGNPGLRWDAFFQGKVCFEGEIPNCIPVSDFVALFEAPAAPPLPKIGDWQPTIIIDRNTLKVGCTEIPFSTVEAIYKAMKP